MSKGMMQLILVVISVWVALMCGACAPHGGAPGEQGTAETNNPADNTSENEQVVTLSKQAQELIGLKVAEAVTRPMAETIQLTGEIGRDTEKFHHVTAESSGEVVSLIVRTGDIVKTGQTLAEIRLSGNSTSAISAPSGGMIIGEHVSVGSRVDQITPLYTIADLSVLHASFDVHEKDIRKIKKGQEIRVQSSAYPDHDFVGMIVFISPEVDEITRTIKARAQIKNTEYLLKFNMFVTGTLFVPHSASALAVPQEAVQEIKANRVVFVPGINGKMLVREVKIGVQSGDYVQILAGLKPGEKVVTTGSFALKSEVLKATFGED